MASSTLKLTALNWLLHFSSESEMEEQWNTSIIASRDDIELAINNECHSRYSQQLLFGVV